MFSLIQSMKYLFSRTMTSGRSTLASVAGMLGAIAATHATQLRRDPELFGPLAASAAVLHDAAARRAAAFPREIGAAGSVAGAAWAEGEGPITALDVAHALPAAIAALSA